jgi:ribosomal protein S18 acetylase RimI-like enzyme
MELLVRQCNVDDAAGIAAVHLRAWRDAYASLIPASYLQRLDEKSLTRTWQNRLAAQSAQREIYAAIAGSHLFGYAVLGPAAGETGPACSGEIFGFYTDPAFSFPILPWRLMRGCLDVLSQRQLTPVRLWVLSGNQHARRYFEAVGFVSDGAVREYQFDSARLCGIRYCWNQRPPVSGSGTDAASVEQDYDAS